MSMVSWLDPLLALLLLLPAAWLATPGTLSGQSEPELAATGWWVLLQLAPAMVLLVRKPRPGPPLLTMYGGFVAISLAISTRLPSGDTLSASRALLIAIASWSALSAGAALGVRGRRVLSYGLIGLSVALSLSALGGISPRFQGALQNSGATSEAALLGALASLGLWLSPDRPARIMALVATIGYGIFVALAPVIAGALCFVCVAGLACIVCRNNRRGLTVALGTFLLAVGATLLLARSGLREPEVAPTSASPASPAAPGGDLGGFAVRLSVGARTLAMFADHPWVGVGPGQFRAQFPPYRAEKERLASNQAAGAGRESEVEHAHDDFLTTLAEVGILGALLWSAILAWLVVLAIGALRQAEVARASLALAVIGGVCNAFLRAPLTFNPASASLFFAAAGALIATDSISIAHARARQMVVVLGLGLLAIQAPRAWSFVRYGNSMRLPDGLDLPAALAACPDAPLALSLTARKQALDPAQTEAARINWDRVLELRPFNFEALTQAGVLAANAGDVVAARAFWERAVAIAPERSSVIQNLLLLEARAGDDGGFERISQYALGTTPRAWAIEAGAKELLSGDERAALRLWDFASVDWTKESAQQLYDRSQAVEGGATPLSRAWQMLAHLRWAREHALTGDFAASVRSYRQALRLSASAACVRLELAAALWSEGKQTEARTEIDRAQAGPQDWTRVHSWAGEVLLKAGLFAVH